MLVRGSDFFSARLETICYSLLLLYPFFPTLIGEVGRFRQEEEGVAGVGRSADAARGGGGHRRRREVAANATVRRTRLGTGFPKPGLWISVR